MTFKPPTIQEAKEYANSIGFNTFNSVKWWHFYNSKGWMVGKNKMVRWRSAIQTWFIGTYEWREKHRVECGDKVRERRLRAEYSDYIENATEVKLTEMRKAPEWEHMWWLIDELRPEIANKPYIR